MIDEAIACLHRQYTFDPRRIHALGISAGGLQSTAHAVLRSQYIASIAAISGGAGPLKTAEERERDKATAPCGADIGCARELAWGYADDETVYDSTSAQILFHGGTRDVVAGNSFKQLSITAEKEVKRSGKFAVLCDHGKGHSWPAPLSAGQPWSRYHARQLLRRCEKLAGLEPLKGGQSGRREPNTRLTRQIVLQRSKNQHWCPIRETLVPIAVRPLPRVQSPLHSQTGVLMRPPSTTLPKSLIGPGMYHAVSDSAPHPVGGTAARRSLRAPPPASLVRHGGA